MSAPSGRAPGAGSEGPTWWTKLEPKQKQTAVIGVAIGTFFLITIPLMSSSKKPEERRNDVQVGELLPASKARELGLTGLSRDVDSMEAELRKRDNELAAIRKEVSSMRESMGPTNRGYVVNELDPAVASDIERLRARLEQVETGGAGGEGSPDTGLSTPGLPRPMAEQVPQGPVGTLGDPTRNQGTGQPPGPPPLPQLRKIGGAPVAEVDADAAEKPTRPKFYLPSGSMISGILITGLDAATGRAASQDPTPALVKIDAEAILPNRYRADIAGCHALLAGRGDLSSERAFLRGESLSCVTHHGEVIDIPLNVYAVGEDGKAGLRGTLVSKQGQAIGKAMLAGVAEGISQSFSQNGNNNFGSGGGVDLASGAESGVYGGFGSGLERVASFYIDLANQIFPVIEISAGRPLTLVVVKGTEITRLD